MVTTKFHIDVTLNSMVLLFCQIKIIKGLGGDYISKMVKNNVDNR